MKNILYLLVLLHILSSCSPSVRFSSDSSVGIIKGKGETLPVGTRLKGIASFYADMFEGRKTANGEIYSQGNLTAAHKTLAFGTRVKVTNLRNGKSIIVEVNDRGPYVDDRIIDLTKKAAETLDYIKQGTAEVELEILE